MISSQIKKTIKITVSGLLLVSLFFSSKAFYDQQLKRKRVEAEINNLKKQASNLQQKNQNLSDSLAFLDTTAYKEKVAKESLNMKQDGEIAVSFIPEQDDGNRVLENNSKTVPNPIKWWYYFFSSDHE